MSHASRVVEPARGGAEQRAGNAERCYGRRRRCRYRGPVTSNPPIRSELVRAGQLAGAEQLPRPSPRRCFQRRLSRTVPVNGTFFWSTMPTPSRSTTRSYLAHVVTLPPRCQSLRQWERAIGCLRRVLPEPIGAARPRWRRGQSADSRASTSFSGECPNSRVSYVASLHAVDAVLGALYGRLLAQHLAHAVDAA